MPTGIRPRVNEAREFLEIAKDFKDPKEIIREALSNSWDAGASRVALKFDLLRIPGTSKKKVMVEITDDGDGMSSVGREGIGTSEIEDFFNLGDSHKPHGSIGTKGHGTKIYYKSSGIIVDTWKNGRHIHAESEVPPWETLKRGVIPTYKYDEDTVDGKGTRIIVDGFEGKQSEFQSVDELIPYIQWYTVVGSFAHYFGKPKRMDLELKSTGLSSPISIPFGFKLPDQNVDLSVGSNEYCKILGPATIACGRTQEGVEVQVDVVGAILGEAQRELVPHTYDMMGLWLCKDFVRIERYNILIERVFGGQYYYRNLLVFANCPQFDLTANRNNIRNDQEEFYLAIGGIESFLKNLWTHPDTVAYFEAKKREDRAIERDRQKEKDAERKEEIKLGLERRLNEYKGRADLDAPRVRDAPIKEPRSEAETALLLQAMISSGHPGIDFRVGEYKTSQGTDLVVQQNSKGIASLAWAEVVVTLENLFAWQHPPEGIHKVICWSLGKVKETQAFAGGKQAKLINRGAGRYHLDMEADSIEVYVLGEILQH